MFASPMAYLQSHYPAKDVFLLTSDKPASSVSNRPMVWHLGVFQGGYRVTSRGFELTSYRTGYAAGFTCNIAVMANGLAPHSVRLHMSSNAIGTCSGHHTLLGPRACKMCVLCQQSGRLEWGAPSQWVPV